MIHIDVSQAQVNDIVRMFNGSEKKSKALLKKAINSTARKALHIVSRATNKNYASNFGLAGIQSAMRIKKASAGEPTAEIITKGPFNKLKEFRVTGQGRKILKAKVLKANKLEKLQIDGNKAFLVNFGKHATIGQRIPNERAKNRKPGRKSEITKHNQKVKALYTVSVPSMVGGEHGFKSGNVEFEVSELLQRNIRKEVLNVLFK